MSASTKITVLPTLTPENLESIMADRLAAAKNRNTVIPMLWQGLLELPLNVGNCPRTAKYYVPKDLPQGAATVVLNIPDGFRTVDFLERSGWMDKADTERFCLFAVEPAAGGWKSPDVESAYISAAVGALKLGQHLLVAFAPYVVGYGRIGALLHKIVMSDPLHTAAAVFLDASDIDAACRADYLQHCFSTADRFDPNGEPLTLPYSVVPVPMWIASENPDPDTDSMISYWRSAAKAYNVMTCGEDTVFFQNGETEYTPEGNILQVIVSRRRFACDSPETTDRIYAFLKQYYRYGMGPLSNAVSLRTEPEDIGAERKFFTDRHGIDREYLVYVPAAYRDGHKKLPVILAYHGASQSMRNMMANGMWYRIADEQGIILVYPESTLMAMPNQLSRGLTFAYRPIWELYTDPNNNALIDYADEMLNQVIADYPADPSRIYCTGHSMGCMMTNYLGSSVVSHRFAAVGATSGCLQTRTTTGTQPVPAFMTAGQFDLWDYRVESDGPITAQTDMWLVRNGLATEENVKEVRTSAAEEYSEGRFRNYVWKDAAGIPWVRYAWIAKKHHVHNLNDNRIFWDQWFSLWQLCEDGTRRYSK